MYKKPSHTNNSHEKALYKNYENNIFVVINQINKCKAKMCNHCVYTQIITKKFYFFSLSYIKMEGIIIDFGEKKTAEKEFYGSDNKKNI